MTRMHVEAKQDLATQLEKVTTFGSCNVRDFETAESVRKEKEKKIRIERKKREEQQRIFEEEMKKKEQYDQLLALEEETYLNYNVNQDVNIRRNPFSIGRGKSMERLIENSSNVNNSVRKQRGRGRGNRFPHDQYRDTGEQYFERERQVQNQLNQLHQMDRHQSNVAQCLIWQGRSPSRKTPSSSRSDSSCSNQFEDASSSPQAFNNHHSPQSGSTHYSSASSSLSSSPYKAPLSPHRPATYSEPLIATFPTTCAEANPLVPSPIKPVKKRRSKIAANFSNGFLYNDDEESKAQDRFSVLTSLTAQPPSFRSTINSISINSLHPSQRVLSQDLLKPSDLFKSSCAENGFTVNNDDFPPLT